MVSKLGLRSATRSSANTTSNIPQERPPLYADTMFSVSTSGMAAINITLSGKLGVGRSPTNEHEVFARRNPDRPSAVGNVLVRARVRILPKQRRNASTESNNHRKYH